MGIDSSQRDPNNGEAEAGLHTSPVFKADDASPKDLQANAGICYFEGLAYSEGSSRCVGYGGVSLKKLTCRKGAWVEDGFC
jgi:hypothetical protein